MARPTKYFPEVGERAVRMVREHGPELSRLSPEVKARIDTMVEKGLDDPGRRRQRRGQGSWDRSCPHSSSGGVRQALERLSAEPPEQAVIGPRPYPDTHLSTNGPDRRREIKPLQARSARPRHDQRGRPPLRSVLSDDRLRCSRSFVEVDVSLERSRSRSRGLCKVDAADVMRGKRSTGGDESPGPTHNRGNEADV